MQYLCCHESGISDGNDQMGTHHVVNTSLIYINFLSSSPILLNMTFSFYLVCWPGAILLSIIHILPHVSLNGM